MKAAPSVNSGTEPQQLQRIQAGAHHDPFAVLGRQQDASGALIRVFLPHATAVEIEATIENTTQFIAMQRRDDSYFFELRKPLTLAAHYRLRWHDVHGNIHTEYDPY